MTSSRLFTLKISLYIPVSFLRFPLDRCVFSVYNKYCKAGI
nr:MAG TPA: hypothetical protein [Caudoviricetes sp.]